MRYEIKHILITQNDITITRRSRFLCPSKPLISHVYEYQKVSPASRDRLELRSFRYPKAVWLKDSGMSVSISVR